MNSLLLAALGVGALALGYRFYGRLITKWAGLDLEKSTPAHTLGDGVDYVPAKHWFVLFGHHFASIAGAMPIVGPVVACLFWGWLPAVLWIVFGAIFMGGVHDYLTLSTSVENDGKTIGDLSESVLGRWAKIVFSIFVLLTLILVVGIFADIAGKTLAGTPQVVVPTFGLIPVAMVVGLLVYRTALPLLVSTVIGLALLGGLLALGVAMPVSLPVASAATWWTVILLIYGMVAAVLPVSLLLQPRDHLGSGVLLFGMAAGFLGIVISHPQIKSPAYVAFSSGPGWLWPLMFVTVACGAISGFHCLVGSGTTSKQLPRAADAGRVGYGAMILESALALMAVIAVSAGLYWKDLPTGATEGFVFQQLMDKSTGGNPIKAFGAGYGELTKAMFGATFGALIGITMLKTFVMTTLDSATRISRYVATELLGETFGVRAFRNRYVATLFVGICGGAVALVGYQTILLVFGSANQLIGALALIVVTGYLTTRGRRWLYAAVPAVLILLTTAAALVYQLVGFLRPPEGKDPHYGLAVIALSLLVLALFVTCKGVATVAGVLRARGAAGQAQARVAPEA